MYLRHFQLKEYPFTLTPDTDFYFDYPGHREVLNVLLLALRTGEGFIKVTGEVGLGKTLLCRKLLGTLGAEFATAYVPDPLMTPAGLRVALVEELGIHLPPRSTGHMALRAIRRRALELASERRHIVLLLDEAHQLPIKTMEAVRLLTNLETEKHKLLQVVMFGQPELDRRLRRKSMRQLLQRVSFSAELKPLSACSTESYIAHRLRVAGSAHPVHFYDPRRAQRFIVRAAGPHASSMCYRTRRSCRLSARGALVWVRTTYVGRFSTPRVLTSAGGEQNRARSTRAMRLFSMQRTPRAWRDEPGQRHAARSAEATGRQRAAARGSRTRRGASAGVSCRRSWAHQKLPRCSCYRFSSCRASSQTTLAPMPDDAGMVITPVVETAAA